MCNSPGLLTTLFRNARLIAPAAGRGFAGNTQLTGQQADPDHTLATVRGAL
jgi:hypothetical protein